MGKSFDDLLCFLLEEIALCGNQGALPSRILSAIEFFYASDPQLEPNGTYGDKIIQHSEPKTNALIDRPFQERIWQWLIRHPECRLGLDGKGVLLSLSEVEHFNYDCLRRRDAEIENDPPIDDSEQISSHKISPNQPENANNGGSTKLPTFKTPKIRRGKDIVNKEKSSEQELRLYTTEDRMWHTLTGHGPDVSKVPPHDFTCLGIIAAHGPNGIIQPNLVKISGQDKRSVPARTQRLCDNGYIIKRPTQAEGSRTSLCILKRFAVDSRLHEPALALTWAGPSLGWVDPTATSILHPCFRSGETDLFALSGAIFDILREIKIIAREDLKGRLGVTGVSWARRVFCTVLRKLMALGCLKDVKALDMSRLRPEIRYFRSVKLIREPGIHECRKVFGPGYGKMYQGSAEGDAEWGSEEDDIDDDQVEPPINGLAAENLQEIDRQIPLWTGTGCVYNLIRNIIQTAGTQGFASKEITYLTYGKYMERPIETQLARLTDCWQISQPLHLRHLAIVKDIALSGRSSHYVYFTFENFKKRVESGNASWEAVINIAENDQRAKKFGVALSALPKLDDFGFPSIQKSLFQDERNVASLQECNRAFNPAAITEYRQLVVKENEDGTSDVVFNDGTKLDKLTFMSRSQAIRRRKRLKNSKAAKGPNLPKGPKGRPRKFLTAAALEKLKPKQRQKYQQSQLAAARYQRNKADKEIVRRLENGEDPVYVRDDVFAKVTAHYANTGQEVPRMIQTWMGVSETEVNQIRELDDLITADPDGVSVDQNLVTATLGPTSESPPFPAEDKSALASAHLGNSQQPPEVRISSPPVVAGQERQPSETGPSMNLQYFPSKLAHTIPILKAPENVLHPLESGRKLSSGPIKMQRVVPVVPIYVQETSYQKQAQLIQRDGCGVFVGKISGCPRKSNQRGRTKHSRLAIFKSARLNKFEWFDAEVEISENGAPGTSEGPLGYSEGPLGSLRAVSVVANSDAAKGILLKLAPKPEPKPYNDSCDPEAKRFEAGLRGLHGDPLIQAEAFSLRQHGGGTATPAHTSATEVGSRIISESMSSFQDSPEISGITPVPEITPLPATPTIPENKTKAVGSSPRSMSADSPANDESRKKRIRSSANSRRPAFIQPVTMSGGSMGVLRRKIIMEIVETCGGVFPGVRELLLPFITAWHKLDKTGKPDARTLQTALNYLVGSAKIRQITFTFQTNKGLMITRTMLALAEISPSDWKVKDMQKKIEESHPSIYLPPEAEFDESLRTDQSYVAIYGRHKIVQETQEPIQMKTMYAYDFKNEAQAAKYDERLKLKKAGERATQIAQTGIWAFLDNDTPVYERFMDSERRLERLAMFANPLLEQNLHGYVSAAGILGAESSTLTKAWAKKAAEDAEIAALELKRRRLLQPRRKWRAIKYKENSQGGFDEVGETIIRADAAPEIAANDEINSILDNHRRLDDPRWLLINSMMNPAQAFHQPTGTFSVHFTGFEIRDSKFCSLGPPIEEASSAFYNEINDLLEWELKPENCADLLVFKDLPFINHHFEHRHEIPSDVTYEISRNFEVYISSPINGLMIKRPRYTRRTRYGPRKTKPRTLEKVFARMVERKSAPPALAMSLTENPPLAGSLQPLTLPAKPGPSRGSQARPATKKVVPARKPRLPPLPPSKRKYQELTSRSLTSQTQPMVYIDGRPKKIRRIRGPHSQNPLSMEEERRLLVAVTVIRTLVGGVDRHIDWVLVSRLFEPKYTQFYIQKRWSHVLHRYRLQVDRIQVEFQNHFAKAYEDGTVPPFDYDDIESYNWEWLVDWTMDTIETSKDNLPYLPARRSEFDGFFEMQEASEDDLADFFEIDVASILHRREAALYKKSNVYPADKKVPHKQKQASEDIATAKTWIRANVVTPQTHYNPELARAKLAPFGEATVTTALQELITSKVLSQQNKGRLIPGRNYDISDHFVTRLKKKLEPLSLHQAAAYKQSLDRAFYNIANNPDSNIDPIIISPFASNGEILAILNLLAYNRLTILPHNPPCNQLGFLNGGYQTRRMDKSLLNFPVRILFLPSYLPGNPLLPLPALPSTHLSNPQAKIPVWYDIHGLPVSVMWELALAATLMVLAKRPGVGMDVLQRSLRPSVEMWELELLLEWTTRAGITCADGNEGGYLLGEWWWMCLSNGAEIGVCGDQQVGQLG